MLTGGTRVFLQRPRDFATRGLNPAVVLHVTDGTVSVALDSPLDISVNDEINIYFEAARKFVQQPIRITAIESVGDRDSTEGGAEDAREVEAPADEAATGQVVDFQTTGPFISAESRESYRVVTVTSDLTAALGEEMHCPLADVSVTGFSVIADVDHEKGAVLPVALRFEDKQFTGTARIQSIKKLITGRTRYGLLSVVRRGETSDLERGQQFIGSEIQRRQLSRRSGNGYRSEN